MTIRLQHVAVCLAFAMPLVGAPVDADDTTGMRVGERASVSGVRFASGEWSLKHSQICPAAARGNDPKIAIYTTELTPGIMKLAEAVEQQIATDESLKWSFVEILDAKGARGTNTSQNYTREERDARLEEIRSLAEKHEIKRLTFGLSSTERARERIRLGIPEDVDSMVVFIQGKPLRSRLVRFVEPVDSAKLDDDMIESLLKGISEIRRR